MIVVATVFASSETNAKGYKYSKHRCMSAFEDSFGPTLLTGYSNQYGYYAGFGMRYQDLEMELRLPFDGMNFSGSLMWAKPLFRTYRVSLLLGGTVALNDFKTDPKLDAVPVAGLRFIITHGGRLAFSPYVFPDNLKNFREIKVGATLSFNFY